MLQERTLHSVNLMFAENENYEEEMYLEVLETEFSEAL